MKILIMGATSAVAHGVALRYAKNGDHTMFCVGRSAAKLEALRGDLGAALVGARLQDFTDTDAAPGVIADAREALGGIDLAIIAHGMLPDQRVSERDYATAREAFEVNVLSVIALLLPLSGVMEAQGHGKIAVITSVAGDRGRPRNYTYGAAKGALSLYLQGLRSRLHGSGVEVYDFKLGPVVSPMTRAHKKNPSFSTVDRVSRDMVEALERGVYTRYVPGFWWLIMGAVRVMPEAIFQRLRFLSGPPDD